MVLYLTLISLCQLLGEIIVSYFQIPIPGPVVGMVILLAYLLVKGNVPNDLARVTDGLHKHMQLLYVPAASGVMVYLGLLASNAVAFTLSIAISTVVGIVVTGVTLQWLTKGRRDG